jgi:hypothetical protein
MLTDLLVSRSSTATTVGGPDRAAAPALASPSRRRPSLPGRHSASTALRWVHRSSCRCSASCSSPRHPPRVRLRDRSAEKPTSLRWVQFAFVLPLVAAVVSRIPAVALSGGLESACVGACLLAFFANVFACFAAAISSMLRTVSSPSLPQRYRYSFTMKSGNGSFHDSCR